MKFFKTLIASTLGALIAAFIIFIVFFLTIVSSTDQPEPYIRDNTILTIQISGNLPARSSRDPFDELFNPENGVNVSLESIKENLEKAAVHDNIKGVLLNIDFVGAGWSNLQEAHNIITEFKKSSGKFVYATTNDLGYNEAGYYLATAADSVFSPPESLFEFDGFYSQTMFYTGLLEKLGIEEEISREGKYKSAVEPYFREQYSEESEYQLQQILDDINAEFVSGITRKTGKTAEEINTLLEGIPTLRVQQAYEHGLIDSLVYRSELESLIKKRIGIEEDDEFHTVSNDRYYRVSRQSAGLNSQSSSNKMAVIYASGAILPTSPSSNPFDNEPVITATGFRSQLEKIRKDDDVKALVIRINSPGGSGSTSDVIWQMIRNLRKEIPVIVSMGPVAASGGYYIAMAADSIVAQPTTITGSIGVFGTKFNTKELFNDKLGITFDEVKSHEHADWLNMTRGFTPEEEEAFQGFIDRFYDNFITKVAESRGLDKSFVDEVAQGRVWTGEDALEQNLVDQLGGLDRAMAIAAEKAGIEEYKIESFPKQKDLFQRLMGSAENRVKSWFGNPLIDSFYQAGLEKSLYFRKGDILLLFPYELSFR